MAVIFRDASYPPLGGITATAPNGAIIGVIGEDGSGKSALLRLASGKEEPISGNVDFTEAGRFVGPGDSLSLAPAGTLAIDQALARCDALVRGRTMVALERLRRDGTTIFIATHETALVREFCDEVWWMQDGRLALQGDPAEVVEQYQKHIAEALRTWGASISQPLAPSMRRGDGRAELKSVETLDAAGNPTMVWRSGEEVAVRVAVRFLRQVDQPVVGIMIRTRIGFEVFGTNTELEGADFGPCHTGDDVHVTFRFRCGLCPNDYTITAASHDPDGVWHDWMEDAVAFTVTDSRYTAGVANLGASVEVERSGGG
jgi:homopolymeric O-antigen transport system ATP-binding protein